MGEDRLIEITSTINSMDGPLATMAYITSLNSSDIYLFLKYVGSSKYHDMNFVEAVFAFSNDYLRSKNIFTQETSCDSLENGESHIGEYINKLFSEDEQETVKHSRR